MSEHKREPDVDHGRAKDDSEEQMFGNERIIPDSTRPPVGTQTDPILPGVPTPGNEDFQVPVKPVNEGERGDKL